MYVLPIKYYLLYTAYCISPVGCPWIGLDAHMFRHNGYGPGTKAKAQGAAVPGSGGPAAPWASALDPGPYPLWLIIRASRAIKRQFPNNGTLKGSCRLKIKDPYDARPGSRQADALCPHPYLYV